MVNDTAQNGAAAGAAAPSPADYAPAATAAVAVNPLAAQIAAWKQQNRHVTEISVPVAPGDVAICYIKNPDRNIIAYALTRTMNKQVVEAGEFLLRNCWLGGDARCNPDSPQGDDYIIVAAAMEAAKSLDLLSAESKKL